MLLFQISWTLFIWAGDCSVVPAWIQCTSCSILNCLTQVWVYSSASAVVCTATRWVHPTAAASYIALSLTLALSFTLYCLLTSNRTFPNPWDVWKASPYSYGDPQASILAVTSPHIKMEGHNGSHLLTYISPFLSAIVFVLRCVSSTFCLTHQLCATSPVLPR